LRGQKFKIGGFETLDETQKDLQLLNADANPRPLRIAFFGHDSNESTIRKRVSALTSAGSEVIGFMFHRRRSGTAPSPDWVNIDLGPTEDRRYARRLARLFQAVVILWQQRPLLRSADIFYARNIDMLLIAWIAKTMTRARAQLVYEALDIHPAMTKPGGIGPILRFIERRLLSGCALLVVSSPTFIDRYFVPIQNYTSSWHLLENKIFWRDMGLLEAQVKRTPVTDGPYVIGWFGVIRCRRSLDMLQSFAATMPKRIVIHIRGIPSEPDGITSELLTRISRDSQNIFYFGPYRSPADLAEIYGAVDLVWAVDFSAYGANSDWLIPNRLYEGGFYGVPTIARKSTATGNIVEQDGRGWCFDEPFENNVADFLQRLDRSNYTQIATGLQKKERSAFVDVTDTAQLLSTLERIARSA
jgi:succinoglycan biosynthesis protein ExoL